MSEYLNVKENLNRLVLTGLSIVSLFLFVHAHEFVAITEILKNPVGGSDAIPGDASHEYIEITNFGTDTLFIDSLLLFDKPDDVDSVVVWDTLRQGAPAVNSDCLFNCRKCAPGASVIILDPDYDSGVLSSLSSGLPIDPGTVIWTIDDHAFGNDGLSDNDGIVFFKGTKKKIDRVLAYASDRCPPFLFGDTVRQTTPQSNEGVSLVPGSLLFCPSSFSPCPTTISPGHCEKLKGGWLVEWEFFDTNSPGVSVPCSLKCMKCGTPRSADASWSVMRRSAATSSVLATGGFGTDLQLLRTRFDLPLDSSRYQFSVAELNATQTWNIDLSSIWAPVSAIAINEVFPRAQTDIPEWFELVNSSIMPIAITHWRYGNFASSTTITQDEVIIPPGGYCIVSKDKKVFSAKYPSVSLVVQPGVWLPLDNTRDTLCLWNVRGVQCEMMAYSGDWFDRWTDQSLERISVHKDGTSRSTWVAGQRPSPGQPNGSIIFRDAEKPSLAIGPLRFTPNGDGKDDLLSIQLELPSAFTVAISVYGFNGKKYCDLPRTPQRRYTWNGKTAAGRDAPVGPFFIVATFTNGSQRTVIREKGILWR